VAVAAGEAEGEGEQRSTVLVVERPDQFFPVASCTRIGVEYGDG
jgi:hypothetical protein